MAKLLKHVYPKGKQIRAVRSGLNTDTDDLELFSGVKPAEKKCRINNLPGKPGGRRTRGSEYSELKNAKQAMKRYYGLLEKPFKRIYTKASRASGTTSTNMIVLLESRLDNIVYRAGFAKTRSESKQMISHGHILVNGKRVTVSSYQVVKDDKISLSESAKSQKRVAESIEIAQNRDVPAWIQSDFDQKVAQISEAVDTESQLRMFKVNHVIELYSK